jgi:hypothetical protein
MRVSVLTLTSRAFRSHRAAASSWQAPDPSLATTGTVLESQRSQLRLRPRCDALVISAKSERSTEIPDGVSNCYEPSTDTNTRNCRNQSDADFTTIGGGEANQVNSSGGTVAGGQSNTAGAGATVGGGEATRQVAALRQLAEG